MERFGKRSSNGVTCDALELEEPLRAESLSFAETASCSADGHELLLPLEMSARSGLGEEELKGVTSSLTWNVNVGG